MGSRRRSRVVRDQPGPVTVRLPNGDPYVIDAKTVVSLTARGPFPDEASLDRLFRAARRVRVLDGGTSQGKPAGHRVLVDTGERRAIAELRDCLRLEPQGFGFHCMCGGDQAIEVSNAKGVQAVIGLHHGRSIRWSGGWCTDARLADGTKLSRWLAAQRRSLTIPVLAVGGAMSFGPMVEQSMRQVADDVTGVVIPDAGHWIPEEKPAELADAIKRLMLR